jgi:serine/threonine protein kinase
MCESAYGPQAGGLSLAIRKGCVPVDGDTYDVPAILLTSPFLSRCSHFGPVLSFGGQQVHLESPHSEGVPPMNEPDNSIRTGPWQPAQSEPSAADGVEMPPQIGRYRVVCVLGEGGYGRVYLAHADQLNRPVAIKVPHRRLVSQAEDASAYLTEAQNVANLDHPHIVPVFDVGSTEDYPCFIVSKFIEGSTLAQKIKEDRAAFAEAAELVARVAANRQLIVQ